MTTKEAIDALAQLAARRAVEAPSYFEKQAIGASDLLSSLGTTVRDNPTLASAALGGGLGAVVGGGGTALANSGKPPERKRSILSSALTGGLAGTALGGGIGLARGGLAGLGAGKSPLPAAMQAGEFIDPATNKTMRIDPAALRNNPGLASEVRRLTGTSSTSGKVLDTILGGAGALHQAAPITTTMAAIAAPIDLAMHAPWFGLARTDPSRVGGQHGINLLSRGAETAKDMLPPRIREILMRGTESPTAGNRATGKPTIAVTGGPQKGRTVLDILGRRPGGPPSNKIVLVSRHWPSKEITRRVAPTGFNQETNRQEPTGASIETKDTVRADKPVVERISETALGQTKNRGADHPLYAGRQFYKMPFMKRYYAGAPTLGAAAGRRLGIYGLPILAEWLGRGVHEDIKQQKSLQELMAQYAKPVEPPA